MTMPIRGTCDPIESGGYRRINGYEACDKPNKALDVKPYDPSTDSIEIEGTRYSGTLFRELGCNFPSKIGQLLRIDKKENGMVTITIMRRAEDES